MKQYEFKYNERLGIHIPLIYTDWNNISSTEQQQILYRWEQVRSQIPDQIKMFEDEINRRERQLQIEDDFEVFCRLSSEIADYASRVIDLNLWFRTHEEVTSDKVHS